MKKSSKSLIPLVILGVLLVFIAFQIRDRVESQRLSRTIDSQWDEYVENGKAYYLDEKYEKAIEQYELALGVRGDVVVYTSLFTLYKQLGEYELAKQNLEFALESNPAIPANWIELANLERYELGASEERIRAVFMVGLEKTTGIVKPHIDLRTNYASYLEDIGDYRGAIENVQFALQLERDPNRREAMERNIASWQSKL